MLLYWHHELGASWVIQVIGESKTLRLRSWQFMKLRALRDAQLVEDKGGHASPVARVAPPVDGTPETLAPSRGAPEMNKLLDNRCAAAAACAAQTKRCLVVTQAMPMLLGALPRRRTWRCLPARRRAPAPPPRPRRRS